MGIRGPEGTGNILLAVLAVLVLATAAAVATHEESDAATEVEYTYGSLVYTALNGHEGMSLIRCNDASVTSVTVPEKAGNGLKVTKIASSAFNGCTMLEVINLPSSVNNVEAHAFRDCTGLQRITVDPANPVYYNDDSGTLLKHDKNGTLVVTCPTGFKGVLPIPDDVTAVDNSAFNYAREVTGFAVDPDNGVFFNDDRGLLYKQDEDGITLARCPLGYEGEVTVPSDVVRIGVNAFNGCTGLTAVTLQPGLKFISMESFTGCTGLTSIGIPDSVTSVGIGLTILDMRGTRSNRTGAPFSGSPGPRA